ncbi:hypothetical protein FB567DRAFT_608859 [Paraphoma chrysanthemicola]|uniref:Uncharacterized protein n=1 Tax=Paraphoma chrysanthemicola TaxID=798071 RepID=A0A8K0VU60_9PLEO|nr:hypothetical protein FB567DRAFT_608859 [Paraphoma chrysanthemicola]
MHFSILTVAALVTFATAAPYPQEQDEPSDDAETVSLPFATPTVSIVSTTSLNIPITSAVDLPTPVPDTDPELPDETSTSTRKNPHWEPIPIFTKQCKCDIKTVQYPCWATDALQRCNYEENFSYGCYMSAAGGCPTPTRTCKNLFQPTPRPGPHPCELRPNPPIITDVPVITTSLPTLNVSLPVVPTGNVSLPVVTLAV